MRELSRKLDGIPDSPSETELAEARQIIARLSAMNLRWNIAGLKEFIKTRQRELFLRT